ncbi:uncharacterized protein BX663DRAFT_500766 [Cokeromyces recurvatus]|uniref:uncharacterized protein n=1 Tax=Cokeromyces recurvatus TaxID=90255 RepID=UPI00222123D0|nr:uncharacterized protein BX663DRAFT_500766 [Cokeromyces recurvatus]KAI7905746.1 hypothetical protein BX663DRAFT_500766 [Cokeromyces recurvatus]
MRVTLFFLTLTLAISSALCVIPDHISPHTRVSANPEELLAHQDTSDGSIKVNKHFVNNHQDKDNFFVKIVDGQNVEKDAFTKEQ